MKRTLNPSPFVAIAKHPEVRPWLGLGDNAPESLYALVENPGNVCFLTDHEDGGYILAKLQPGLYAAHTLAMPSARGKAMLGCMRDGFASMFKAHDAIEIVTTVPDGNPAASRWAEVAGFREVFRREACFPLMDEMVGASFRSLHYGDWVIHDKRHAELGELFHQRLKDFEAPDHPDDPIHDLWVGATLGGCLEGNLLKSIGMYNRWAAHAGYGAANIVSVNPPVIDIGTATIQLTSGRLDILKPSV